MYGYCYTAWIEDSENQYVSYMGGDSLKEVVDTLHNNPEIVEILKIEKLKIEKSYSFPIQVSIINDQEYKAVLVRHQEVVIKKRYFEDGKERWRIVKRVKTLNPERCAKYGLILRKM